MICFSYFSLKISLIFHANRLLGSLLSRKKIRKMIEIVSSAELLPSTLSANCCFSRHGNKKESPISRV